MRYNISLNKWDFKINELNYSAKITTPHTWNVDDKVMKHRGKAEYETTVFIDESLRDKKAFISFNAVYHTARVYVNDTLAGEHSRSGFTPFKLDATDKIIFGADNKIKVIVDNTHIDEMLPHKDDFDWSDDGGIIRRAELQFTEKDAVEYIRVQESITSINDNLCSGSLLIKAAFLDGKAKKGTVYIIDYSDNKTVIQKNFDSIENEITVDFEKLKL